MPGAPARDSPARERAPVLDHGTYQGSRAGLNRRGRHRACGARFVPEIAELARSMA